MKDASKEKVQQPEWPWERYLPEARRRVDEAKLLDPSGRIRMEEEDDPDDGGSDDGPDLTAPEIQEAIQKAVASAESRLRKETEGLKKNRDDILAEKKRWSNLGDPEEIQEKLTKYEELERKASAAKAGLDPEKFNEEVERVAAEKDKIRQQEFKGVLEDKDKKLGELQQQVEQLNLQAHRHFVAKELVLGAMPEQTSLVQEGAWDHLIDSIAPYVVEHKVDGYPHPVARLRVNDSLVPGGGPDNLMTMREALPQLRLGKGPLPINLSYCFASNGSGSGTQSPTGKVRSDNSGNWWRMSEEERSAYINEKGPEAAKDLIDRSERPSQEQRS